MTKVSFSTPHGTLWFTGVTTADNSVKIQMSKHEEEALVLSTRKAAVVKGFLKKNGVI